MKIVLASASPRRKMLLEQIGIRPEIRPSGIEEIVTKTRPEDVVMELSARKAEDVAGEVIKEAARAAAGNGERAAAGNGERAAAGNAAAPPFEDTVVIGADTVVAVGDRILGKPKDREEAIGMLHMLAGTEHQVYTGVTLILIKEGKVKEQRIFAERTDVQVYPMSEKEICDYADSGEPLDKAGAYGIQGRFAAYIRGIRGDYSNVVGLPVGRTCQELKTWLEEAGGN